MEALIDNSPSWEQIDRCESYLVCCMFDEAASLASSVIKNLCAGKYESNQFIESYEVDDMLESAGMVFVQSLNGLGRASEILNELNLLYNDVAAIPVQVLHTGACIQITGKSCSGVQEILEDFFKKWNYVKDGYYVRSEDVSSNMDMYKNGFQSTLEIDKYLEIVELYVTFLVSVKEDMDLAISWVEEASLPEGKQQELLRRLHSRNSSKVTTSSQASFPNEYSTDSPSMQNGKELNGSPGDSKDKYLASSENARREAILKLYGQKGRPFWWFRTITLRFGSNRFDITNGNMFLACLALIIYYVMRKKQINLKRFIENQVLNMKKSLVDLWKLAFSYQVNPLAAVQAIPTSSQGSR